MKGGAVALAIAALLGLWNLGGFDLWAPDEPFFAEGAREMVVDGEWLVPHVNGKVNTHKPPLFFWLIALFSLPLGEVNSWTARLPSALAALGTVALTWRLGRRLSGSRAGALAALLLATTYLHFDKARSAQIDATLSFLILAALSAFEAFRAGQADGRRAGLLFWFCAALAVLAKGPVGVLLPLGIALVTLAFDRNLGSWRRFAPWSGPVLFAVVVASWAAPATLGSGGEYSVWAALKEHFVDRARYGMHHVRPFWYYARVLPIHLMPWTGLVLGGLWLAWKRRRQAPERLLLVWAVFVVLFFSISTEKRDLYVLPAYAAFALLASRLVGAVEGWIVAIPRQHRRWVTIPQGLSGALFVLVALAVPFFAQRVSEPLLWPAVGLAAVAGLGGLVLVAVSLTGRSIQSVHVCAATMVAAFLVLVTAIQPALNPQKSARAFAQQIKTATAESRAAGDRVLAFHVGNVPKAVALYTNGVYLVETEEIDELAAHLSSARRVFAVVNLAELTELPEPVRSGLQQVETTRLSRMQIALVRNR